ncbi:hypothetical protein FBU30_010294 [Linnemannia zychae]|nr:hypothetical protein FBU30_010294 [Linnemannia zychae]
MAEQDVEVDDPAVEGHIAAESETEPMEEDQHSSTAGRDEDMEVDDDDQQQRGSPSMQVDSVTQSQGGVQSDTSHSLSATSSSQYAQNAGSRSTATTATESSGAGGTSTSRAGTSGKSTVPTVDEKAQSELRRKIMEIQRDTSIKFADKAGMIQAIQEAAQHCNSCKARMAVYYCDTCKLWDDDPKKHIYHCDDCGICRIGQGLGRDYFHCKKCNVCMNIQLQNNHKCIERNLECDCPICGEYMFTSTSTVIFMPCGHCIHSKCHEDYIKTSYQCPTCWKSLGDMSAYYSKIDSLLAEQTMPPDYANIFSIVLCNDCEVKSEAPYHFLYHRCDKCRGYNTKVLETFKRVGTDGQVQAVDNAIGVAGATAENNAARDTNAIGGAPGSSSSSSAAALGSSGSNLLTAGGAAVNVTVPRSPLMDENASGDMSMAGISGNSAP